MNTELPEFTGTDRYAIRRHIGGGSMGMVYEGFDRKRNLPVAIKTLKSQSDEGSYRLKQEFRTLSELSHPNLVKLYEFVGDDDRWFVVMELIKGRSFTGWVREEVDEGIPSGSWGSQGIPPVIAGQEPPDPMEYEQTEEIKPPSLPPDIGRLRDALTQLLRGIATLHSAGKLHRDIKPSNVLVTDKGRVVLVDFGLIYDADRAESELSMIDKVVGTAAYMPPEQARGEHPAAAADMYCVGVMLFKALTGRLPFEGPLLRVLLRKQEEVAPPPSLLVPAVPEDLDQLCIDLLHRDPEERPTAHEVLERLGQGPNPTFSVPSVPRSRRGGRVEGREAERQELEDAWARARSGETSLARICGASGMGKTSLVQHFLREVRQHEDVTVLRGRCFERESVPFKAFDQLVDGLRRRLQGINDESVRTAVIPTDISALARLFPALRTIARTVPAQHAKMDPDNLRHRAFSAFQQLLRNLTVLRPVILFLDDVHWGDRDSARLLSVLLRDLTDVRLLVLLGYRSEDVSTSEFLLTLEDDPSIEVLKPRTIELRELSLDRATAVARGLIGDDVADPAEASVWIAKESGGNPFLLSELAASLRQAAADGKDTSNLSVHTLDDLFHERIDALDESARAVMKVVALADRPIPIQVAAKVSRVDEEVLNALSSLRAWHLVRTNRGPLGDLVEPYHTRIAASVRAGIPEEEHADLHLDLAKQMESLGWSDPEVLMEHYEKGGDTERASFLAQAAARGSADSLAFDRAARLYRKALSLREWGWEETESLQIELGDALVYAGRGHEAAEAFLEAASNAGPSKALELRRKAAGQLIYNGQVQDGLSHLQDVLAAVGLKLAASPAAALRGLAARRVCQWFRGLRVVARTEATVSPEDLQRIDTCWFLALGLALVDPVQGAWFHAQNLHWCLKAGEPYRTARALAMEIPMGVAFGSSNAEVQARLILRGRELAALAGHNAHAQGLIAMGEGLAAFWEGRWGSASRSMRRAERIFTEQCAGVAFEVAVSRLFHLKASVWLGELPHAQEEHARLLREADSLGNFFLGGHLRADELLWLRLAEGKTAEARNDLAEVQARWSRDIWDQLRFAVHCGEVDLLLYEGRASDALEQLDRHQSAIEKAQLHRLHINRVRLADLRGRTALSLARTKDKRHTAQALKAAKALARENVASAVPLAHLLQAGAALIKGQHEAGMDHLLQAREGLERAEMWLHAAATRYRLGALLPGNDGRREQQLGEEWLRSHGVADPKAMVALLAPGSVE